MKQIRINLYAYIDIAILIFIFFFILSFFRPQLLFLETTINGGDTGSHYPCAAYLKEVLLPQGKITGWMQGNYAGFPLFYHYFPLPFITMAVLNVFFSLQVAFKLVSVMGIFLLPLCVYLAFRIMKYKFPIPIIAAVFTLPFLFHEGNSMWGGNIPSTLAGEFCYSISFSFVMLFMGTLYRGVKERRFVVLNAILIPLIALCHAYTFLFCLICGSFFLITDFKNNVKYLFTVYGLAFLLLAFWTFPLLANLPYTTSFVVRWTIHSLLEVFPVILMPFCGFTIVSICLNIKDHRTLYLLYLMVLSALVYLLGPYIGFLDIRFVPFIQILLCVMGASVLLKIAEKLKLISLLPLILFLGVLLWVNENTTYVKSWIKWNYSGYENKRTWDTFNEINQYLRHSGTGRVVWEHTPLDEALGSIRTSETLPYFAKRQTLEGIHMLGAVSAPFVFFIESETSYRSCNPIPTYFYATLDIQRGMDHFELFNVDQFVVRSPELKKTLESHPRLKLEKVVDEYQIYRLAGHESEYVVPLKNQPVLFVTDDWKDISYQWFTTENFKDTFLVFSYGADKRDIKRFEQHASSLDEVRTISYPGKSITVKSVIHEESIDIETSVIGHPLLVKVSFHPNWKVTGAEKIFLASPSFMIIFPTDHHVTLTFTSGRAGKIGFFLTMTGVLLTCLGPFWLKHFIQFQNNDQDGNAKRFWVSLACIVLLTSLVLGWMTLLNPTPPDFLKKAKMAFDEKQYAQAGENYLEAMNLSKPSSGVRCESMVFYATCLLRENRFEEAIEKFRTFIEIYPNSFWTPQAYFDLAHCYGMVGKKTVAQKIYRKIIHEFSTTSWARYSKSKLKNSIEP